jgi:hypothetical protein
MKHIQCSKLCIGKHLSGYFSHPEWSKTRICFITTAFQLCFTICLQENPEDQAELKLNGTHQLLDFADNVNLLGNNTDYK